MMPLLAFICGAAFASQVSLRVLSLGIMILLAISILAFIICFAPKICKTLTIKPNWYRWIDIHKFCLPLLGLSLSASMGLLVWLFAYLHVTRWQLPSTLLAPVNVSLEATVVGLSTFASHSEAVTIAISPKTKQHLPGDSRSLFSKEPVYVRLQWYQTAIPLLAGEHWWLKLRLRPLHGFQNPGSFSYVGWLQQQDIQAVGAIIAAKKLNDRPSHGFTLAVARLRNKLRQAQVQALPPSPLVGIFTALCLGDKSLVSPHVQQVFMYTGTAHLLAISGLHVGLIAGLIWFLGQRLWRLWPRLCLYLPAKTAGYLFGVLAAWGYALLAGFAYSTERAAIMVTFAAFALTSQRRFVWLRIWIITLFVVLMLAPLSVTSSGLWLSFAAVLALSYLGSYQSSHQGRLIRWLSLQIRLTLLLAPLMLALFHRVSLASIPANLLAIPWIGSVIVPLSLLATLLLLVWPWLGHMLLLLALYLLTLIWPLLTWFAYLPHVTWAAGVSNLLALGLGLIAMVWLLAPTVIPWRGLSIGLMLPAWLNPSIPVPAGGVRMTVLDVGQGLSVVIQTLHHAFIYDTGPGDLTGFNAGSAVLVPFLYQEGIRRIDKVILSHGDNDHIAGFLALHQAFGQIPLVTSAPSRIRNTLALSANYPISLCMIGMHWRWDEVDFRMLYPGPSDLGLNNNSSCVLQIEASGRRILLAGDIEAPAELHLYQRMPQALASDVLIVPHHGSAGAALPAFIMTIAPKYAIFSTGYMNRFHFPRAKVIASYQRMHSLWFNTANAGAITVTVSPPNTKQSHVGKLNITTNRNT